MNPSALDAPAPRAAPAPAPSDSVIHVATSADSPAGKRFDVDSELVYDLAGDCDFVFQLHAYNGMGQKLINESLEVTPGVDVHVYEDPTLRHRFLRLKAGRGTLSVRYRAQVLRLPDLDPRSCGEMPISELPDEVVHNLMPTRYCESDLLSRVAQKMFCNVPPGYSRVQAISDWIHENIDYQVGSSNATTTARDVFLQRAGVCRDFAHLGVTFCRALNIPARLVVGYARFEDPPPDFHAVFEAYLDGRWVLFDPTRMSPVSELIRIAMGRDAKDVAFATIFGPAVMTRMDPAITSPDE